MNASGWHTRLRWSFLSPGHRGRLAVACIDNADEVRFALAAAAADLAAHGRSVAVIDLTEHGSLDRGLRRRMPARPSGPSCCVHVGYRRWQAALPTSVRSDTRTGVLLARANDVTLLLADLDPSVGADHLTAWTDRVFVRDRGPLQR